MKLSEAQRVVCWFSCGAPSSVAAKLVLAERPDAIVAYTDTGSEHPDSERYLRECEDWLGVSILRLKSKKYRDIWQVFSERRFLNSPQGALCTTEMKKMVRQDFEQPGDVQVFGYSIEEQSRVDRFRLQNPEVTLAVPLIDRGLTKSDCKAMIDRAGIELPAMYRLGYRNNNCVGCVKGGKGYWNKIRVDFPNVFERMSAQERDIGHALLKEQDGTPIFLDELDPSVGRIDREEMDCSLLCYSAESEYSAALQAQEKNDE
jgi:hypothetical protein